MWGPGSCRQQGTSHYLFPHVSWHPDGPSCRAPGDKTMGGWVKTVIREWNGWMVDPYFNTLPSSRHSQASEILSYFPIYFLVLHRYLCIDPSSHRCAERSEWSIITMMHDHGMIVHHWNFIGTQLDSTRHPIFSILMPVLITHTKEVGDLLLSWS
jgi:hypothetical protein